MQPLLPLLVQNMARRLCRVYSGKGRRIFGIVVTIDFIEIALYPHQLDLRDSRSKANENFFENGERPGFSARSFAPHCRIPAFHLRTVELPDVSVAVRIVTYVDYHSTLPYIPSIL